MYKLNAFADANPQHKVRIAELLGRAVNWLSDDEALELRKVAGIANKRVAETMTDQKKKEVKLEYDKLSVEFDNTALSFVHNFNFLINFYIFIIKINISRKMMILRIFCLDLLINLCH